MNRWLRCISCLVFACLTTATMVWGELVTAGQKIVADRFVVHVVNCDFDSALTISDSITHANSDEPLGPLLRLLALGMRDLDYERHIDTADFVATYNLTVRTIAKYEQRHGRSSLTLTLAGFANATHASYYLRDKRYFTAIGTGLDAMKLLYEAKALDSTNYDADFFLGMYDYAKAELRKRLWMVLFWYGGDKIDGIRRLEFCAEKAQIAASAASMSLADVFIQEKQFAKARTILDNLLSQFPRSRFILWSDAKYYEAIGNFSAAAAIFGRLAHSYELSPYGRYNSLATRQRQITMLCKAGKRDEARRVASQTLSGTCQEKQPHNESPCSDIRKWNDKGGCDDTH